MIGAANACEGMTSDRKVRNVVANISDGGCGARDHLDGDWSRDGGHGSGYGDCGDRHTALLASVHVN